MYTEIHTVSELLPQLATGSIAQLVIQGLALDDHTEALLRCPAAGAVFLGCSMDSAASAHILRTGGVLFPQLPGLPYHPFRPCLYTVEELMAGYVRGQPQSFFTETLDSRIYRHYQAHRRHDRPSAVVETLAQRLHDHAIDDALNDLLHAQQKRAAGVMGGHSMRRDDARFADVAHIGWRLARTGRMVATGGGPGAMEAANLGAWMSSQPSAALDAALAMLREAPAYTDAGWIEAAFAVRERWPEGQQSLAIPTWFYGHEPSNLFSTHIAKYFANSIREEGLLAIATGGVVFAPGSAGTIQEVFMDATQNHYGTFSLISPMVFLGEDFWTCERPVLPLLTALSEGRDYRDMIAVSDDVEEIISFLLDNPPRPCPAG